MADALPSPADAPGKPVGLRVVAAILSAALVLAVADIVSMFALYPLPASGVGTRLGFVWFDVAETLGVGGVIALAAGAFVRLTKIPARAGLALGAIAIALVLHGVIGENVTRGVQFVIPPRFTGVAYWAYLFGLGVLIPVAHVVAASFEEHVVLRVLTMLAALCVLFGDQFVFFDDYQGVHGVIACGAAFTAAGVIAPFVEGWLIAEWSSSRGRSELAGLALVGVFGLLVPPPNGVRFELFRQPCAVAPWALVGFWSAPSTRALVPPLDAATTTPWFHDRSGDPPVPPSTGSSVLPPNPVVVLLTIDATRADVVFDPANAKLLPTFTQLMRRGVTFRHAMASGTQTPLSLAAVFSGRTFSEMLWTEHGQGMSRFLYPADDPSPRFPEVLSAHGVETYNIGGLVFLANDFGVLRGFKEERMTVTNPRHAAAAELVDPLLSRLRHASNAPLFAFTHLTEPHEPYDRGRRDGTPFERYVSEVAVADKYVGRVLAMLDQHFGKRWVLIVSSDHGEAFGEHHTHEHAKSLYEELVHVPLIVVSPAFAPRVVEDRVSLADLGPTILDLFGQATPATFLGESLVPYFTGGHVDFTRPLFVEGRLRQAMVFPDGTKVIEDLRRKTVEVYDLNRDPDELVNLWDTERDRSDRALVTLRAFFAAHTRTEGGYVPPFKP